MHKSEIRKVPLLNLRDGSEHPFGNYNIRKGGDDADLGPLRASLKEDGQFQLMVGTTVGDGPEVYLIIGNRRRRAAMANQDESPKLSLNEMDVRVFPDLPIDQAMGIAIAEKLTELPMHEVDQYEAFAALGDQDPKAIAAHFGCSERLVKQRQKLGRLAPKIRQAWRDGVIDADTAKAFTLAPDEKTQNGAFTALAKVHSLNPRAVRARLLPDQGDAARLLHFAAGEYQGAGGCVIVDLFQEQHGVTDAALLKKVADDKLAAIADVHAQDGFAWCLMEDALPGEWHGWKRLRLDPPKVSRANAALLKDLQAQIDDQGATPEVRRAARVEHARLSDRLLIESMTAKQRAQSGIVLSLNVDGGVTQAIGVLRPKADAPKILADQTSSATPPDKAAPTRANAAADPEPPPRLSPKAQSQRAAELTIAAAQVLEKHPALALIVLVAGFADRGGYGAIRAKVEGSGANALQLMQTDDIAQNVKKLRGMKPAVLQKLIGQAAAASLVFQAHSAERAAIEDKGVAAVIALLPPKDLAAALKRVFDPEDYFGKGLPKELALDAIRENCGQNVFEDQRAVHSATDLRAFALANIKDDWLPPELRFPGYAGPGAKKTIQPAKGAKKAQSKRAKR